ncbi:HAD-like domain-containing protein [Artemisia annua]|uniref:HAD-like domain-containing protein n=1 Tax=Artemisia annua TaxID=35608 RepID=A0A2U1QID1_ARTAN|nr:HAD-like domain-containing protein [Artemisia annua]
MKMEFEGRRQKYDCLLFDLDDTLYPVSAGLAAGVLNNIKALAAAMLCLSRDAIGVVVMLSRDVVATQLIFDTTRVLIMLGYGKIFDHQFLL